MYFSGKLHFYNLFISESDSLDYVTHKPLPGNDLIQTSVHQKLFVTLEYKGNLVLIAKSQEPLCLYLTIDPSDKSVQNWSTCTIHLSEVVICGSTYNETVYILGKFYVFMKSKTH